MFLWDQDVRVFVNDSFFFCSDDKMGFMNVDNWELNSRIKIDLIAVSNQDFTSSVQIKLLFCTCSQTHWINSDLNVITPVEFDMSDPSFKVSDVRKSTSNFDHKINLFMRSLIQSFLKVIYCNTLFSAIKLTQFHS